MVFTVTDAIEVRDKILKLERNVNLTEMRNILSVHTGTTSPHWLRIYHQSMVTLGLIEIDTKGLFKANDNWKPIA